MTVAEAIARADALRPNPNTTAEKTEWLSKLDAYVYDDLIMSHEHDDDIDLFVPYVSGAEPSDTLLIEDPHSDIYVIYLICRIELAAGEFTRYSSSAVIFNTAYSEYQSRYTRQHKPLGEEGITI